MKNKNENRNQIIQQFVSKSNQIMDDIFKLTAQIQATYPSIDMHLDETPLFAPYNSGVHRKE